MFHRDAVSKAHFNASNVVVGLISQPWSEGCRKWGRPSRTFNPEKVRLSQPQKEAFAKDRGRYATQGDAYLVAIQNAACRRYLVAPRVVAPINDACM